MKRLRRFGFLAALAVCAGATLVDCQQTQAAGVAVGASTLGFDTLDYSDTFTGTDAGGAPFRPYIAAVQGAPAYVIENHYNSPPRSFQIGSGFSFAGDGVVNGVNAPGFVPGNLAYPAGANASGAGSDTGFTQTGGGIDYGVSYGLRDEYWVQVDAVQTADRIDISSGGSLGIFAANSLSVFFRGDGSGNASLFNGSVDTAIRTEFPAFNTGIAGSGQWNNYAVRYDRIDKEVELYVNQTSLGVIDLTTFAGGIYQNFSNAVVGAGGAGNNRTWTDNFQVGGNGPATVNVHPDPGNLAPLPANLVSFWDFNEASGVQEGRLLDFAYDRAANRNGVFVGTATRTSGIVGNGAAQFNDANGDGVNVGRDGFSFTDGVAVEAIFISSWAGNDQAEFFRKEDGGNRILLSFQTGANINSSELIGTAGTPGISLGLNIGGAYNELDVAFDGLDGRPSLAEVSNGEPHHIVGSYDVATGEKAIFFDGQKIGSWMHPAGSALVTGGTADGYIGADRGGEPFAGIIDEVAIYRTGLTQDDINAHLTNLLVNGAPNYFNAVPEPSSCLMTLLGLLGLTGATRRRRA